MTPLTDPPQAVSCAQLLEATARALRSGLSLSSALGEACRIECAVVNPRIVEIVRRHELGEPLVAGLADLQVACRDDEAMRLTVTVLHTAAAHGGASAEALDRAASTLRRHATLAADADAHAAPAQLSATMLTLAPMGFSAAAALFDTDVRHVLVATPVGWICLVSGITLSFLGRRWMTRLVEASR